MDKAEITKVLHEIREKGPKRKFSQTIDLQCKLHQMDIKNPDQKVDKYIPLPHQLPKKVKICIFCDTQVAKDAKKIFDTVITKDEFKIWAKEKKKQKRLAQDHDFFVAQDDVMALVAATFGKVLGPKGKMPSPKAGCVVPATVLLKPLYDRLQKLVKIATKNELAIKAPVGNESMSDQDIVENIDAVYGAIILSLPQQENNLKKTGIKLTMGPLYTFGEGFKQ